MLYGLPHSTINPLLRVQSTAARVTCLHVFARDHVRPALKELHWLPVTYRIQYKVALLMYIVHDNRCPQYLTDSTVVSAGSERHNLRSTTHLNYILPRTRTTFGERAFSVSGPIVWNNLPLSVRLSPTLTGFRRKLKSHFLNCALN